MKFLSILTLSLIGTAVAAPLHQRAASSAPKGVAKTSATPTKGNTEATPAAEAEGATSKDSPAKASSKPEKGSATGDKAAAKSSEAPAAKDASGDDSSAKTSSKPAKSSDAPSAKSTGSSDSTTVAQGNIQSGGTPAAPAVQYAAGAFANDANTVSASLNALGTEQDPEMIRSLATTAFQAESDEDQRRNVLNTAGGSQAKDANALIVKNTPAVLDGLQAIMTDPTPATAKSNLQTIEDARNPNILPSITKLTNAAMVNSGLQPMAVEFQATTGATN
ncbi:PPE family protein [Diplocarpon rosae]|nr:PPE family protein [Diplocarpon rosae]